MAYQQISRSGRSGRMGICGFSVFSVFSVYIERVPHNYVALLSCLCVVWCCLYHSMVGIMSVGSSLQNDVCSMDTTNLMRCGSLLDFSLYVDPVVMNVESSSLVMPLWNGLINELICVIVSCGVSLWNEICSMGIHFSPA